MKSLIVVLQKSNDFNPNRNILKFGISKKALIIILDKKTSTGPKKLYIRLHKINKNPKLVIHLARMDYETIQNSGDEHPPRKKAKTIAERDPAKRDLATLPVSLANLNKHCLLKLYLQFSG